MLNFFSQAFPGFLGSCILQPLFSVWTHLFRPSYLLAKPWCSRHENTAKYSPFLACAFFRVKVEFVKFQQCQEDGLRLKGTVDECKTKVFTFFFFLFLNKRILSQCVIKSSLILVCLVLAASPQFLRMCHFGIIFWVVSLTLSSLVSQINKLHNETNY